MIGGAMINVASASADVMTNVAKVANVAGGTVTKDISGVVANSVGIYTVSRERPKAPLSRAMINELPLAPPTRAATHERPVVPIGRSRYDNFADSFGGVTYWPTAY